MRPKQDNKKTGVQSIHRVRVWYAAIVVVCSIFIVRLFYLQVIRYGYYEQTALNYQRKQYQIPAKRGLIYAHDGTSTVPLVLNQQLYTLFADPKFIKKPGSIAGKLAAVTGGSVHNYEKALKEPTQYVVLAKKLSKSQSDEINKLGINGIGTRAAEYRSYPEGSLAAQVLGFVNENDVGTYGIEQALNSELKGKPGQLKAITDVNGVPLVSNKNNVIKQPTAGDNVTLTLDLPMQSQLEQILKTDLAKVHSKSGDALIIDPYTGKVLAMASYPTYNPANYANVQNSLAFDNTGVTSPLEIGSSMKILTTAAALDTGAITKNETFFDPARYTIDGFTIHDIKLDGGPQVRSITDILTYSLNTGATWELMQMGGGKIDAKGRHTWYDYMTQHYQLGKPTGIEQGYESSGYIPPWQNKDNGINLTYANTAFGQAVLVTPIQLAAAVSSVLDGGTYYQPHLVSSITTPNGKTTYKKPKVIDNHVVKPAVGVDLAHMMEVEADYNIGFHAFSSKYIVGGKTGTAQVADIKKGGYYPNKFNGTYAGFVGGNKPQYVIVTRVNDPHLKSWLYAGHDAAQPVFVSLVHMLINDGYVTPKH